MLTLWTRDLHVNSILVETELLFKILTVLVSFDNVINSKVVIYYIRGHNALSIRSAFYLNTEVNKAQFTYYKALKNNTRAKGLCY